MRTGRATSSTGRCWNCCSVTEESFPGLTLPRPAIFADAWHPLRYGTAPGGNPLPGAHLRRPTGAVVFPWNRMPDPASPSADPTVAPERPLPAQAAIGPYRLVRLIGRG